MTPQTAIVDRAERTHLFLVATLYCGVTSNAVRVRNLSGSGALVEGASLPAAGTPVILRRGALEAVGTVAWATGGKAGLAFSGLVDVAAWLPGKEAKPQCQVDQLTFGMKHAPRRIPSPEVATEPANAMAAVVAELKEVQAQLGVIGEQLARDPNVRARYPQVQLLSAAGLRIGQIVEGLAVARA